MEVDFMTYTHRMEKAGIYSLWISLGADKEGYRLMHVTPDAHTPPELAAKFPTRTFRIDGTDPILQAIKDEMLFSGDGKVTIEKIDVACALHPQLATDLREFYLGWSNINLDAEDAEDESMSVDEKILKRGFDFAKGLMRGIDSMRGSEANKRDNQPSTESHTK